MTALGVPKKLPLLFIYNHVLLPGSTTSIHVTSIQERKMVKSRLVGCGDNLFNTFVGVITKKNEDKDIEISDSVPTIGTVAVVSYINETNWPRPTLTLYVTGLCRFQLEKIIMEEPYPVGTIAFIDKYMLKKTDTGSKGEEFDEEFVELTKKFKDAVEKLLSLLDDMPNILRIRRMLNFVTPYSLADLCTSIILTTFEEKLALLNALDIKERFKKTLPLILRRIEGLENGTETIVVPNTSISSLPKMGELTAKLLRQRRFGNNFDFGGVEENDIADLREKLKKANLPPAAEKVATGELKRLKNMSTHSSDHGVIRNYLEFMAELPWAVSSKDNINLRKAKEDLDADHYGLKLLKKRVLEFLAVRLLRSDSKGPILCFFGPPGVGKTSVAQTVANILGRKFQRISLGGVCTQSEVRGHRKTYVGAMHGRILQAIKQAGVNNPVILLDEIDKLSHSLNGNPADALLEVLDPEQNHSFVDHYLNVPFDLSQVLFIATANQRKTIPIALVDRMEFIDFDGYTQEEKLQIALRHLLPKQMKENGINETFIQIPSDSIQLIIKSYTSEPGVRELQRKLGALCRAVAVRVAERNSSTEVAPSDIEADSSLEPPVFPIVLDEAAVEDILGPAHCDDSWYAKVGEPGVALGLVVTYVTGKVFVIEASKLAGGDGNLVLTGQLGSTLKESARIAFNWVRSAAERYGFAEDGALLNGVDVHIHFLKGASPKDGPSAGIAIATALMSLFSGIPVTTGLVMTGELSLRGVVYPVGGINEKVLAAHREGLKRIILPKSNEKDLFKIPNEVKSSLSFVFVNYVEEVIDAAFDGALVPKVQTKVDQVASKL